YDTAAIRGTMTIIHKCKSKSIFILFGKSSHFHGDAAHIFLFFSKKALYPLTKGVSMLYICIRNPHGVVRSALSFQHLLRITYQSVTICC
ncbi:MAG: hypothetical protein RSB29_02575, partial [Alistipes sp.]